MPVDSSREVFEVHMPKRLATPGLSARFHAAYKFVLTGEESSTWFVDLTRDPGAVREEDGAANCTITVPSSVFLDIVNGKLSGGKAFTTGKLKVQGDVALALKIGTLLGK
jgi:putative sterol carrier protein